MPIDLYELINNKIILPTLGFIATFILSTFLAPRIGEIIKSLTAFTFLNIKHWFGFIVLASLLYFVISISFVLATSLAIVITLITSLTIALFNFSKKPTLLYLGSYFENNSDYLDKNIETEKIDSIVEQEIEEFKKNSYLVKTGIIKFESMDIPRFYILMKSYKSLNLLFRKRITKNNLFGYSFFINSNSIHYKSYLNTNKHNSPIVFQDNLEAIQNILESNDIVRRVKVSLSLKVNFVFLSQSFNDMFLAYEDLTSLKHSLDDTWKVINSVKEEMRSNAVISQNITNFIGTFEASYHRYYAILLFKRKDYHNGFSHLFDSLKINPYFPYNNYNEFKRNFATRYYLEILPLLLDDYTNKNSALYADIISTYNILLSRLEDNIVLFTVDIVKEFVEVKDLSVVDIKWIELKLNELDENVANLLFKSEVLKFLPKGYEQVHRIYVDRIEECICTLEKIIGTDSSFPLIHQKIGILKLMLSQSVNDESLVREATDSLKIGFYEIKNLGVNLVNNAQSLDENIDEASVAWIQQNIHDD